jgi:hypothetical protein
MWLLLGITVAACAKHASSVDRVQYKFCVPRGYPPKAVWFVPEDSPKTPHGFSFMGCKILDETTQKACSSPDGFGRLNPQPEADTCQNRIGAMDQYNQTNLLDALVRIFPDFAEYWMTDIANDEDPSSSLHSVYMSFLPFVAKAQPTPKQWKLLAKHFSEAVAAGGGRENAAATCFFEALDKGPFSRTLRPLLSKEAKAYVRTQLVVVCGLHAE